MKFSEYLLSVNGNKACKDARLWNGDRTLAECWRDCERGDWMMWLLFNANLCDVRTLTKIKAMQADLVKHLMKDERSLTALQGAHDFGNGLISDDELARLYDAAADAYDAAAYAADADAYAAAAAAYAAADAYAYADAADAADAARAETLKRCADIVREVIPSVTIDGIE